MSASTRSRPTRVLVVEDSVTVRRYLVGVLEAQPDLEVVGEAGDGPEAVLLCRALTPDVVTLDLQLPSMSGLEVTEHVMAEVPARILVVSAAERRGERMQIGDVLAAGAIDALDKPADGGTSDAWARAFVLAVRRVARVAPIRHPRAHLGRGGGPRRPRLATMPTPSLSPGASPARALLLGASTGGPAAVKRVLRDLPASFPLPIVIVIHVGAAADVALAAWLGQGLDREVRVARDGEHLPPVGESVVRIAPSDHHLTIASGRLWLDDRPELHSCRPSVDALFESAAHSLGRGAIACILTGMGRDGAAGLLAVARAGGATFAQDEASSVVYGMPAEAVRVGAAQRVVPLDRLGAAIASFVRQTGAAEVPR